MGVKTESINENVIRSGVVYDEVERRVSPEGGDRYVQMVRAPLRNGAGSIIGILGICWDVTERRRLEGQMRVLVRAVEQSPASIVLTDTSGNIEFVNPKFTRVTGYTAAEVLGKQTRLLKSDETPVRTYEELWRTITSGKEWHGEFRNKRKDGTLFWEMASISPIRNSAGEITHYMAVKEYVTELKMTQAKFLRAQRLESIGSLASGIAHDLNNILAPIIMSAPMLAEEDSREVRQEIVKTIENCGQRAVSIVRQLLGFARGKDGHKQAVQVRHLVREMFKVARETFPRNISVTDSCANDLWIVAADATQIHQVLLNLSVNARDAMPQGGRLTFGASNVTLDEQYVSAFPAVRPGRYVRLEVADTGTGIPDQVKEHIFETFFTTKGEGEGTGLGLTTVQGIVEEHGGFMGFTSESGQGTTFTVHLPAMMDDATMAAEGAPESHSAPRGRGEWVLLVDDEPTIQETTRRTLERHGYHVVEARNGVEGLAEFSRHQHEVRVVITDCGMPVMDGVTMTRALRAIMPHLPILVSSGGSFTPTGGETLQAIKEIGGIRVLQKPHTAEALLQTLSEMLNPAHFTGQSAIHERTVPK